MTTTKKFAGAPLRALRTVAAATALLLGAHGAAQAQDTYKIAYIDPLSGPFANVGELMLLHTQYAVDDINAHGGLPGFLYSWYRPGGRLSPDEVVAELTRLASRVIGLRTKN